MRLKLILPAMAAAIVSGASIASMPEDDAIQGEEIEDSSCFPMPTLPGADALDNAASAELMQDTEYATELANGYSLISVKRDPFYGEITPFHATPEIQKTVADDDTIQDLVKKGVIVFDYMSEVRI